MDEDLNNLWEEMDELLEKYEDTKSMVKYGWDMERYGELLDGTGLDHPGLEELAEYFEQKLKPLQVVYLKKQYNLTLEGSPSVEALSELTENLFNYDLLKKDGVKTMDAEFETLQENILALEKEFRKAKAEENKLDQLCEDVEEAEREKCKALGLPKPSKGCYRYGDIPDFKEKVKDVLKTGATDNESEAEWIVCIMAQGFPLGNALKIRKARLERSVAVWEAQKLDRELQGARNRHDDLKEEHWEEHRFYELKKKLAPILAQIEGKQNDDREIIAETWRYWQQVRKIQEGLGEDERRKRSTDLKDILKGARMARLKVALDIIELEELNILQGKTVHGGNNSQGLQHAYYTFGHVMAWFPDAEENNPEIGKQIKRIRARRQRVEIWIKEGMQGEIPLSDEDKKISGDSSEAKQQLEALDELYESLKVSSPDFEPNRNEDLALRANSWDYLVAISYNLGLEALVDRMELAQTEKLIKDVWLVKKIWRRRKAELRDRNAEKIARELVLAQRNARGEETGEVVDFAKTFQEKYPVEYETAKKALNEFDALMRRHAQVKKWWEKTDIRWKVLEYQADNGAWLGKRARYENGKLKFLHSKAIQEKFRQVMVFNAIPIPQNIRQASGSQRVRWGSNADSKSKGF